MRLERSGRQYRLACCQWEQWILFLLVAGVVIQLVQWVTENTGELE
jgi:hypothetical protein